MTLGEFKKHIESFSKGHQFEYSISEPFSWRGIYAEVAFSINQGNSTKEEILAKIDKALTETFIGWKGGDFNYNEHTDIHFEESHGRWTDGGYAEEWLEKITGYEEPKTIEHKLVGLLFQ